MVGAEPGRLVGCNEAAVAEVRRSAGEAWAKVRAIGLSGQMHGAVLLDAAGVPLRPAILHNDGRSHAEAKALNEKVPGFGAIAGVPAMAGFLAPKLLWMKAHEPDILRQTAHVLLPKDYVRFRMTGSYATDMSDGSGAVLLDTGARQWSNTIIEACGIAPSILPPVLEGLPPQACCKVRWRKPSGFIPASWWRQARAMRQQAPSGSARSMTAMRSSPSAPRHNTSSRATAIGRSRSI